MANGPAQPPWRRVVGDEPQHTAPHSFSVRNPGPRQLLPRNSPPLVYFLLLFSITTMTTVLRNTRAYAESFLASKAEWILGHPQSRFRRWRLEDLSMTNLKKFFGLCINMGLVRKKNVADYWSKSRPSTYVPFFAKVMSFRLFAFISRVLHAGDPDAPV